ncbi:MAG: S-formylglutathione hydrolase [Geminicoccaceae bacterium]
MSMELATLKRYRCFGGMQGVFAHESSATGCRMELAVYEPPQAERARVPVLYWLSGLTCTWANFTEKAGAQRYAAEHGLMIVAPDTSPRGTDLPGEHEAADFGSGAGFYVDATVEPWARHYRMYSYVTRELPALIEANFPAETERRGIFGHSMGGHGALICALRSPDRYRSLSAFAPIAAPMRCPWGEKALSGYLGEDREAWRAFDATELAAGSGWRSEVLVDQGTTDEFLDDQLKPQLLQEAFRAAGIPLTLRYQAGYDHSYYTMASFMGEHVAHHARLLTR